MPNPKRRHSNQRTRKRRTHDKVSVQAPYVDHASGVEHRSHRICSQTGYYRGKQVIPIKTSPSNPEA